MIFDQNYFKVFNKKLLIFINVINLTKFFYRNEYRSFFW